MRNKYRVDVATGRVTPCGMNSIKYVGNDWKEARNVFASTLCGKDAGDQPNTLYGVILSVWNGSDYVVKCEKGLVK